MTETTIQATAAPGAVFRVGGLLGQTFQVMFANIVPFGLIALALTVLESLLYWALLDLPIFGIWGLGGRSEAEFMAQPGAEIGLNILGNFVISTVLYAVLTATLIYGTVMYLRNSPTTVGAYLSNGGRVVFPVVIVSLIVSILAGLGSILLIVPGVLLFIRWWVAVPAVVVERAGIGGSLSRSAELTRGNRWRVLGALIILLLISTVLTYPFQKFGGLLAQGLGSVPLLIIAGIIFTFARMMFTVATGVGYYQLRVAKEGADIEQIAAVFD